MSQEKINYLEFPAKDLEATKAFFAKVFDWQFTDYGPEYVAFSKDSAGIDGGFFQSELTCTTDNGGCLTVLFSDTLEKTEQRIVTAGGTIVKPCFEFPGGRRFHFSDPNGNEFAVWSDK